MSQHLLAAAAALGVFASGSASNAQDYSLAPTHGPANLVSGFDSDPYVVAVEAGGAIDVAGLGPSCAGFVAEAPDVRLSYAAGASGAPLILSVNGAADTMLLVNTPDGHWHCDNDGGEVGGNPMLRFAAPQSGQYDIWIGGHADGSLSSAELYISESQSQ
jgi:hypothetical protein